MKEASLLCLDAAGYHRVHYYDWGDPDNPRIVVCVHGLTRNGRDFDFLAQRLSRDFRVVCPDVAGRGKSDWLRTRGEYVYPQYLADMAALAARVTCSAEQRIAWVGTSMGGLLGMLAAARPGNPIAKLVVNDAGMIVPKAALERLARYVGKDPVFPSLDALEAYIRRISVPFGNLTDAQWRHLALHSAKQRPDGQWAMRYDPAIGAAFEGALADVDLSAFWDAITCPTLLIRGADSDLLLRDTAAAMTRRGPKARLVEFQGMGHAPMLMCDEQADAIHQFLLEKST